MAASPTPVKQIAGREHWHRGDRSGVLRAGVFGVSDGLVSNTALVMGFAGSGATRTVTLLAGVAGLLSGSFSMAAGRGAPGRQDHGRPQGGAGHAGSEELGLDPDQLGSP